MERIISKNVLMRTSFIGQATGLMFRKKMKDFAMIFPFKKLRTISVTMFFVFYPIDIIFLDSTGKIVEIKNKLKPFTNYFPSKKSNTLIELPLGYIKKYNLKINSKLKWTKNKLILTKP